VFGYSIFIKFCSQTGAAARIYKILFLLAIGCPKTSSKHPAGEKQSHEVQYSIHQRVTYVSKKLFSETLPKIETKNIYQYRMYARLPVDQAG
jgi:hypothetical protein